MNLLDFIGFIFSFLLFIYLSLKKARGKTQAQIDQEEGELKEYLRSVGIEEMDEEEIEERAIKSLPPSPPVKPPKPPKPAKVRHPSTQFEQFESFKAATGDAPVYETEIRKSNTRVDLIINNTRSLKDMVILKEVLGPPKAYE